MTVIICANERNIHWAFDSRTDNRARANPDTLPGTYWAIAAAFAGEPLDLIYFHEVGSLAPIYADPYWMGILAYLKIDLGGDRPPAPITDYPEFLSPDAERIELVTADYLNASCLVDFDLSKFKAESIVKYYNLPAIKIQIAIEYAQKLIDAAVVDFPKGRLCQRIDSQRQLDKLFEWVKSENEELTKSEILTERFDIDSLL
jgi:hypothetical protein